MELIAERCPILVQLSTGVGLDVLFEERAELVELRPRMATLNPCSTSFGAGQFLNPPDGVRRLAARMRDLGVLPELEVYDTGRLEACLRLRDEGLLPERLQFSLVLGVRGGMAATADNLLTMVRRLPADAIWQVIAIGRSTLELTAIGLALGGNAGAGLQDALHLRRGVRRRREPAAGRANRRPRPPPRSHDRGFGRVRGGNSASPVDRGRLTPARREAAPSGTGLLGGRIGRGLVTGFRAGPLLVREAR
ncbi:3-keto-5-aminohexanoate cleavage protein [Umezawaea beigongshangensis]|uniref:3-keto-5-aminohexanoate cleavage protein n=1 Tax=Umezawaea beigongshangensis TaxID=2780383 RepID=UPI0018F12595